jgi:hypothetical protein
MSIDIVTLQMNICRAKEERKGEMMMKYINL